MYITLLQVERVGQRERKAVRDAQDGGHAACGQIQKLPQGAAARCHQLGERWRGLRRQAGHRDAHPDVPALLVSCASRQQG